MHKNIKITLIVFSILILLFVILMITLLLNMCEFENCDLGASSLKYILNENKADIVITFTTMPNRLQSQTLKKVLSSFFEQEMRPSDICLNIPYFAKRTKQKYIIPPWLELLPITIARCDDYGPATKYIPTIKYYLDNNMPNQRILVYDDDSVAPPDLVKVMNNLSNLYPNYCITPSSYKYIDNGSDRLERYTFVSEMNWAKKSIFTMFGYGNETNGMPPEDIITFTDMALGWVGFLLTPNMVQYEDISNFENLPQDAFFVDDVVISASLLKNGTKIVVGKGLKESKPTINDLTKLVWSWATNYKLESLAASDNKTQSHDAVMENYYKQYWQFLNEKK